MSEGVLFQGVMKWNISYELTLFVLYVLNHPQTSKMNFSLKGDWSKFFFVSLCNATNVINVSYSPLFTGRKLHVHKTFRGQIRRFLNFFPGSRRSKDFITLFETFPRDVKQI